MNHDNMEQTATSNTRPVTQRKPNNLLRNMTQLALPLGLVVVSIVIVFNLDTFLK